jgi:aldehyde:ferredoxin oxidoreductase
MDGYTGKILRIDLSSGRSSTEEISAEMKEMFVGGRGFTAKMVWDEVRGVDPLSAENNLYLATGPLTGQPVPSSGKMVIASKSPLTGGYGDTNIGSRATGELRAAGYDVLVIEGKSPKPCYVSIEDKQVEIRDAADLWGKDTFVVQDILEGRHGKKPGLLIVGPAGENQVRIANIMSQKGRAAGRTGMGAVMGSKNLKALVLKGSGNVKLHNEDRLKSLGKEGYADIKSKDLYSFWIRQGTMMVIEWANANNCIPTFNYQEAVFAFADRIDGYRAEELKVGRKGCPYCNMQCGIVVRDAEGGNAELDYENIAMLGSNLGMKNLGEAAALNRIADEYGLDTISLGSCLGFLMEASEKKLIDDKIAWGDFEGCKRIIEEMVQNRGTGALIFEGVKRAADRLGGPAKDWGMQVKGMEISAYNCKASSGQALAYGTSPIGAHHKDAFMLPWELKSGNRQEYGRDKAEKLIWFQRWRGGLFEAMTVCRLPWMEVDFSLEWYPRFLEAATGMVFDDTRIDELGDRIYALIRAYWVREKDDWSRQMDMPPARWFDEPLTTGDFKGTCLDRARFDRLLSHYYELRGWNRDGIPTKETLERLGLGDVAAAL